MSQKIPLFQGVPLPLHNGNYPPAAPPLAPVDNFVFTPPDKALNPQGTQAFYELHLWVVGNLSENDIIKLRTYNDDEGAGSAKTVLVASMSQFGVGDLRRQPTKILDGYPVRGKVTLDCQYITDLDGGDFYPAGAQLYGYYVRAGEGVVHSPARRFIGAASPDGIAAGVPHIVGGVTQVIHTFDGSRFDELGLQITATDHLSLSSVGLAFVDENMVPVGPGGVILVTAGVYAPFAVGDYLIESVFGGYPNLKYLIAAVSGGGADVSIHGYFTRR